jgi:ribonuclease R
MARTPASGEDEAGGPTPGWSDSPAEGDAPDPRAHGNPTGSRAEDERGEQAAGLRMMLDAAGPDGAGPDPSGAGRRGAAGLPSREAVRRFIRESPGRVGKREISREFGLGPEHRAALREMLRDLAESGAVAPAGHRRFTPPGRLPDAMVVLVTGTDPDGDAVARPLDWQGDGPPPLVLMAAEERGRPALAPGERVLARLKPIGQGRYEGRTLKRLSEAPARVLGVFKAGGHDSGSEEGAGERDRRGRGRFVRRGTGIAAAPGEGRLIPTDRRSKAEWRIPAGETEGAEHDEIVLAQPLPSTGYGLKTARVVERLGRMGDARSVSLICVHTHGIPTEFDPASVAEAEAARAVPLGERTDLRDVALVTIDGEDARDFDDAVFAEPDVARDGEAANLGGHRLIVAIADVAHYVRPGSALDRDARRRGNSVYFPDRVVPMLPEALSNGWCSLRPAEERGCLFVEMRVDASGRKLSHRFGRGLMRSAARLTYTQVQALHDREAGAGMAEPPLVEQSVLDGAPPVPDGLVGALYAAFRALLGARQARGTLDLDLPERKVVLDEAGQVCAIAPRPRLDSHRLIEEFMVLANVAAAEELERRHRPCMYRVHAPPSDEKMEALRAFLRSFDIALPPTGELRPRDLDQVLREVAGTEHAPLVNEVMLRSQSQAAYDPDNIGHFGLSLGRYAHFTSPIRRYADLLVHRALVSGMRSGDGALPHDGEGSASEYPDIAEQITGTERRAALAEREAVDRYLSAYMADKVGAVFAARISGVARFGLFVTLDDSGASGLVPLKSLPDDYWMHDETTQSLVGRSTRLVFHLAQAVEVRLSEATPVTGGLLFGMLTGSGGARRDGEGSRPRRR